MDSILKNVAGADECMRDEWVLPNGLPAPVKVQAVLFYYLWVLLFLI